MADHLEARPEIKPDPGTEIVRLANAVMKARKDLDACSAKRANYELELSACKINEAKAHDVLSSARLALTKRLEE